MNPGASHAFRKDLLQTSSRHAKGCHQPSDLRLVKLHWSRVLPFTFNTRWRVPANRTNGELDIRPGAPPRRRAPPALRAELASQGDVELVRFNGHVYHGKSERHL